MSFWTETWLRSLHLVNFTRVFPPSLGGDWFNSHLKTTWGAFYHAPFDVVLSDIGHGAARPALRLQ